MSPSGDDPEPPGLGPTLEVAGRSDPGRTREENQDSFLVADLSKPAPEGALLGAGEDGTIREGACRVEIPPEGCLLLVADGMGGAAAGDVASRLASATVQQVIARPDGVTAGPAPIPDRLAEAVEEAGRRIHDWAARHPDYEGMGSTMTAAVVHDGTLHLAQVGDSRAYLVRDRDVTQLTRDQTMLRELVDSGSMTEEAARESPYGHMLLQALGTEETVDVVGCSRRIQVGDRILLCSDGLTGPVSAEELAEHALRPDPPGDVVDALLSAAIREGGPDNVTVVLARVADGPAPGEGET